MQSAAFLKWSWITDRQLTLLRRDTDIEVHSGPMLIIYEEDGGEGWIRTSVRLRGQIYSLLPLTTRPPLQVSAGAPCGGRGRVCQPAALPECQCSGDGSQSRPSLRSGAPKYHAPQHDDLERVKGIEPSS